MSGHWGLRCLKFAVFGVLFVLGAGWLVQTLWNDLMPGLFGWKEVTWAQALGLLVLARILVGGFHGRGCGYGSGGWRRRMAEKWEKMSPEEREKFRKGMGSWCGPWTETPAEPKA